MNGDTVSQDSSILKFIDKYFEKNFLSDKDWIVLKQCMNEASSDDKYILCEWLSMFFNNESEQILISMLSDNDSLVRAAACDSLSRSASLQVINVLTKTLKSDKNKTVRGYAALSIGDIQKKNKNNNEKVVKLLKEQYAREKSVWTQIAIARSLVVLNDDSYLGNIYDGIKNRYYTIRSFSLNLIMDLIENFSISLNSDVLLPILYGRMNIERTVCVRDTMQRLIELLEN